MSEGISCGTCFFSDWQPISHSRTKAVSKIFVPIVHCNFFNCYKMHFKCCIFPCILMLFSCSKNSNNHLPRKHESTKKLRICEHQSMSSRESLKTIWRPECHQRSDLSDLQSNSFWGLLRWQNI